MTEAELLSRLLYRDGMILIVNKPAGLPVHSGPKGGQNLEQYFHHLQFGLPSPPALAHRLDRDTSGCLILGRHRKALRRMGILFQGGNVSKTYWALCQGRPATPSGTIDFRLTKKSHQGKGWWMKVDPAGMETITDYQELGHGVWRGSEVSWIEAKPKTGRTHQIRVHLAELGCPIWGDPVYGADAAKHYAAQSSLMLHARSVSFPLQDKKPPVAAQAPVPDHMIEGLQACGWSGDAPSKDPSPEQ